MTAWLDNPIWHALTTEQVRFAERDGDAARFAPAVTGLGGMRVRDDKAIAAFAQLVRRDEVVGVLLDEPLAPPPGLAIVAEAPCLQMVHEGPAPAPPDGPVEIVELGPDDGPAMVALAEVTKPGPFGARTAELGTFLGVRDGTRLIAMTGQRMRLPGMIEVSAVCTDPAYLGRGHAARLMTAQLALIVGGGATAFLHVKADNQRAVALYERFGFRTRRVFHYEIVRGV